MLLQTIDRLVLNKIPLAVDGMEADHAEGSSQQVHLDLLATLRRGRLGLGRMEGLHDGKCQGSGWRGHHTKIIPDAHTDQDQGAHCLQRGVADSLQPHIPSH